ncbi:MAG: hypothetical protein HYX39_14365 [Bacteroidetes bacterium]|nr:hypothetical protein [Bacteroidota bacterium]
MPTSNQENESKQHENFSVERKKYFIQMLDIKRDTNMIRIYSAISQSSLLNETINNSKIK